MDQPAKPDFKKRELIAARVSAAFKARGYQLVQYGGATVEQYSRGKYATSDVDLGFVDKSPSLDIRAQVMESLGCERGTRLYLLDGVVVDLGGQAELLSSHLVEVRTPEGLLLLEAPEESLVQRVLMSVYPQDDVDQKQAALLLMIQALSGNLSLDWNEVERLAALPGFKVQPSWLRIGKRRSEYFLQASDLKKSQATLSCLRSGWFRIVIQYSSRTSSSISMANLSL